jgi:hypothetical protein
VGQEREEQGCIDTAWILFASSRFTTCPVGQLELEHVVVFGVASCGTGSAGAARLIPGRNEVVRSWSST